MGRKGKFGDDDQILFRIVDLFFRQRESVGKIAKGLGCSRQTVYNVLPKARERGLVRLVPPAEQTRAENLEKKYRCKPGTIKVVDVADAQMGEHVPAAAAARVLELIKEVRKSKPEDDGHVGLGLGPGRATLEFSRHLAALLPGEPNLPPLDLFAISAGCPASNPQFAPVSFFNLYPAGAVAQCVGLFAENMVERRHFERIKGSPGIVEGFEKKERIDVIVTAMGDIEDPHDLLRMFLEGNPKELDRLREADCIGNVQYRPFGPTGPIEEAPDQHRAVTLFELKEFVERADRKDKHVVLIARTCGACGRTRANALLPLLTVPALKVWSEIFMDLKTADELLLDEPPSGGKPRRYGKSKTSRGV